MEKELEQEKAKFMMQYWTQCVLGTKGGIYELDEFALEFPICEEDYLSLTPLSLISDEDLEAIGKLWVGSEDVLEFPEIDYIILFREILRTFKGKENRLPACIYQHLLQNSYALDYYSAALRRVIKVEEQVNELGWVKLKEGIIP